MASSAPVVVASNQSSIPIAGDIANDAADSGNPVKIGGVARTTNPTAVADGDRVDAMFDKLKKQVMILNGPRELDVDATTTITASTTETTILAAGAAGVFHDLTVLWVANTSATDVRVDFRSATAGSVRFSLYCPAGNTVGVVLPQPIRQAAAANNWTAQSSASVTDLRIYVAAIKVL